MRYIWSRVHGNMGEIHLKFKINNSNTSQIHTQTSHAHKHAFGSVYHWIPLDATGYHWVPLDTHDWTHWILICFITSVPFLHDEKCLCAKYSQALSIYIEWFCLTQLSILGLASDLVDLSSNSGSRHLLWNHKMT